LERAWNFGLETILTFCISFLFVCYSCSWKAWGYMQTGMHICVPRKQTNPNIICILLIEHSDSIQLKLFKARTAQQMSYLFLGGRQCKGLLRTPPCRSYKYCKKLSILKCLMSPTL
jgi:hypothetical protein